ncbi:hypothetical protein N9245_00325 [bacterium]|nr:hypothetical protein [bacterium]
MSSSLKRIGFFKNKNKYIKATQVPTATFSISESANEISVAYTIDTNKPNISLYYSTGGSATANDFTDNTLTGNISLDANGNATIVRTINSNNLGLARTFSTDIRINSVSGKIVYSGNTYLLEDNEMMTTQRTSPGGPPDEGTPTDYNYYQRTVYANITLDGVDYQQIQVMQNQADPFGPQPTLDQFTIKLSPGKGPLGTTLDSLIIAPGAQGGLMNPTVLTGGGGGGGGQVIQQTLTYDSNQTGHIDVSLPLANLITSDPANANTVMSNLFTLSGSNPSSITALHGELGEQGQLTKGGDGGFAGNSSSYSDPGSGAGGRTTNTLTYPYGAGPSEGANGTYSTDFTTLIYHRGDLGSQSVGGGSRYYVTQKSTSGSGSGAVFDVFFPNELQEVRNIPNYNPSNVSQNFEAGVDPMNQMPSLILIQGQAYSTSGNAGIGYNLGDTVTLDGADLNGVTGTHDVTVTIHNVYANGAIRHLEGGSNANLNGISNITGGCPVMVWKEDLTDNVVAYPNIVAPYTMNDPATFNADTAFHFFGGGGGVSKATLSGGIAYFGRGILGQGGKGEHFNNNGSNPDMYATDGAGGSVLIRWRRFAPFRTIQIS